MNWCNTLVNVTRVASATRSVRKSTARSGHIDGLSGQQHCGVDIGPTICRQQRRIRHTEFRLDAVERIALLDHVCTGRPVVASGTDGASGCGGGTRRGAAPCRWRGGCGRHCTGWNLQRFTGIRKLRWIDHGVVTQQCRHRDAVFAGHFDGRVAQLHHICLLRACGTRRQCGGGTGCGTCNRWNGGEVGGCHVHHGGGHTQRVSAARRQRSCKYRRAHRCGRDATE